ncbi:hypothetical protein MMC11_007215 [Xylographa trunciseda]|nr:hypothetical protein [Xylographa trunciseda]
MERVKIPISHAAAAASTKATLDPESVILAYSTAVLYSSDHADKDPESASPTERQHTQVFEFSQSDLHRELHVLFDALIAAATAVREILPTSPPTEDLESAKLVSDGSLSVLKPLETNELGPAIPNATSEELRLLIQTPCITRKMERSEEAACVRRLNRWLPRLQSIGRIKVVWTVTVEKHLELELTSNGLILFVYWYGSMLTCSPLRQ